MAVSTIQLEIEPRLRKSKARLKIGFILSPSNKAIPVSWIFLGLFALVFCGIGILYGMSDVAADEITPAQDRLITIGDWMIETSVGAILGFAGGTRLAASNAGS